MTCAIQPDAKPNGRRNSPTTSISSARFSRGDCRSRRSCRRSSRSTARRVSFTDLGRYLMTGPSPVRDVSVTFYGVTYEGTYYVQCYMVYVQSPLGKNVT